MCPNWAQLKQQNKVIDLSSVSAIRILISLDRTKRLWGVDVIIIILVQPKSVLQHLTECLMLRAFLNH